MKIYFYHTQDQNEYHKDEHNSIKKIFNVTQSHQHCFFLMSNEGFFPHKNHNANEPIGDS